MYIKIILYRAINHLCLLLQGKGGLFFFTIITPNGTVKQLAKEHSVFASPTSAGCKVSYINKVPATASSHNFVWISSTSWLDIDKASIS